ncbi:MAG: histone deacetylase [Myxococcota bacterium]|nr:histone deacetylase [Myxococcota bacterium]
MNTLATSLPVIWHEGYEVDIGSHVFPTTKFRLVRDRLASEGPIADLAIERPTPATDCQIELAHTPDYIEKINEADFSYQELMMLEVPFSSELREGMWLNAGGTILTARKALEVGIASHIGGGFHHAFPSHGEGFCLINDVAVAIRVLKNEGMIERAMVLDCDVHHGNGTAAIFFDDPSVFTFSIHQQNNYPLHKPPSDLDVGLLDGTGDAEYLTLLEQKIPEIIETHDPQLVLFLAGADPYQHDQLGGLDLTMEGLRQRDRTLIGLLRSADIPIATCCAGGYATNPSDTVEIHCNTIREARTALTG